MSHQTSISMPSPRTPILSEKMLLHWADSPTQANPDAPHARPLWPEGDPDAADLRERCRYDGQLFAETFFPHYCTAPFNAMHLAMFALSAHRLRNGIRGWKDVIAAPRDSGKTSMIKILTVRDILYRHEKYIGFGSANFDHARDKIKEIRDIFTDHTELIRIYGPQHTGNDGYPGRWAEHDFITRTGVRCRAFSPKMKTRGFLWEGSRLTLALLDDVEDPELVLTPLRRERLVQWLNSDVAALGEPTMNLSIIGTVLHPESMLSQILKNPGFTTRTIYRAVERWAETDESIALWNEWREMFLNLDDEDRLIRAHQFYCDHEKAMLADSAVFWEARQSYEWLMIQRLIWGEHAFWQERMNDPQQDARFLFDMEHAISFHTYDDALARQDGKLVHFLDMTALAGYWDPTPDRSRQAGDLTCFVVAMKDKYNYIYVVDCYCAQEPSTDVAIDAIVDLIWYWRVPQVGVEINGFASLLPNELRRKLAARAEAEQAPWAVTFVPVKNVRNKILRIRTLDPLIANGWLAFSDKLPNSFLQPFRDFIPVEGANKFDDPMDATEGVCRVLAGLFDRRAAF